MPALFRVAVAAALTAVAVTGTAAPAVASPSTDAVGDGLARALAAQHGSGKALLMVKAPRAGIPGLAKKATGKGATIRHRFDKLGAFSVTVPRARAAEMTAQLQASGATVTPVATRTLQSTPNDPGYAEQAPYYDNVKAPAAWDLGHGSSSVKIAVVDSGVDVTHPDLAGKVVGAYNAHDNNNVVTDTLGHGTFVAGVAAAASNNSAGVAGAGYDSSLLAVKVADSAGDISVDDEVAGINWAVANGAKIINLSLGSPDYDSTEASAVAAAQAAGVLVVAAAGNESSSAKDYPAGLPGVIAVGATNAATGLRTGFSNYGSWVTVAAPGYDIYSTTPLAGSEFFPGTGGYDYGDGTSFSAPLVAGELGLLAAQAPGATPVQLKQAVIGSAHAISGAQLGAGLVDFAGAFAKLPPGTTPTLTSPAAGPVSDTATLTATSSATSVQFSVDHKAVGGRVAVSSGSASTTWSSWSVPNGPHEVEAADCNANGCAAAATVAVTVSNAVPTLSTPAADAAVTGVVDLATSTTAPAVRFSLDGTPIGAVVPTSGGTAATTWTTYGWADGSHTLSVAGCSLAGACGDASSTAVTLTNDAPAVTAPAADAVVGGATTFTATAPGGGVAFLVDGVKRGFDGTAPYAAVVNLSLLPDGPHTVTSRSCNASGSTCSGPTSAPVSFTASSLHPKLIGPSSPISPNSDGRDDVSTVALRLPDTESATWSVLTPTGAVFSGPHGLGSLAKGDHRFSWNGRSNGGTAATNGLTYTVQVTTVANVNGKVVRGLATGGVRIDTTPPSMSKVVGANAGFFPVVDGYRDTVSLGVSTNERGTLSLRIINSKGTTVRTASLATSGPGAYHFVWNGRTAAGTQLPAGTYRFSFVMTDQALNRRGTGNYAVGMSLARLVQKSAVLLRNGNQTYAQGGSAACAYVASTSAYRNGLRLVNVCKSGAPQVAAAYYGFQLPAAVKYTGLRLDSYGLTHYTSWLDGVVRYPITGEFDEFVARQVSNKTSAWTTILRPGLDHIDASRVVRVGLGVENNPSSAADYDIDYVRLVVSYQVLG